ncbi:MAG: cupin domain-containing protein [Gammaproteobacteria bacterium]
MCSSVLLTYAMACSADPSAGSAHPAKPKLENLLSTPLEGVKNTEVIVSRVSIPPNTTLPKHWHPGEEFAYIIDGSVTLWQKGKADTLGKKGDVVKVPLKQIHTASTQNEGAVVLVFRVHETGKPERIKVD